MKKKKGSNQDYDSHTVFTRRELLYSFAMTAGLSPINTANLMTSGMEIANDPSANSSLTPTEIQKRLERAYRIRMSCAEQLKDIPPPQQVSNHDEDLPDRMACYSKALPHNNLGQVDSKDYDLLLKALKTGKPGDFERIPMAGPLRLANPQAAYALDLIGLDASQWKMIPAPGISSARMAWETAELYWQAMARDIPFARYESDPFIQEAVLDLNRFSDPPFPPNKGVTSQSIFRGNSPGDLNGPYISQFLWRDIPLLPYRVMQKIRTAPPQTDYMTQFDRWLAVQNGAPPEMIQLDPTPRYIRNGRDLAELVHRDFTYQTYLCAALILFHMGAPLDSEIPYKTSRTQTGFVTFGAAELLTLVPLVTNLALKAAWFQKWLVHRRIRPEEFGGLIHNQKMKNGEYPIHAEILNSPVLDLIHDKHGSTLLPQAYPEGCPTHPSYPASHAAIAGACVTVLKAFFDESFVFPDSVLATPDGLSLQPYRASELTIGGELNKLASNIALGRDFAGVHYRSDSVEGLKLGEEVAIELLKEFRTTCNESFDGFTLQKFDGSKVKI